MHGGGEVAISPVLSLTPAFAYHSQGELDLLQIGTGLKYYISEGFNPCYIDLASHYRFGNNAVAFIATAVLRQFYVGVSYDNSTNELQQAGNFDGGFELSLGYIFGQATQSSINSEN